MCAPHRAVAPRPAHRAHGMRIQAAGRLQSTAWVPHAGICLEPKSAVYYTNRALCYHKKHAWEKARAHARRIERHASERRAGAQVASDCSAAIAIDDRSIKGFYLLGAALVEQGAPIPQRVRAPPPPRPPPSTRDAPLQATTTAASPNSTAPSRCAESRQSRTATTSGARCSRRGRGSGANGFHSGSSTSG